MSEKSQWLEDLENLYHRIAEMSTDFDRKVEAFGMRTRCPNSDEEYQVERRLKDAASSLGNFIEDHEGRNPKARNLDKKGRESNL